MATAPEVRAAAREFLPYAAAAPLLGVAPFMLDGVFIGATRSRDMRNMMAVSLVVYAVAVAALVPFHGQSRALAGAADELRGARRDARAALPGAGAGRAGRGGDCHRAMSGADAVAPAHGIRGRAGSTPSPAETIANFQASGAFAWRASATVRCTTNTVSSGSPTVTTLTTISSTPSSAVIGRAS